MTTIKITALTDIGANIPNTTLIPVVDMTGTPTTDKATFGNVANAILSQAGNNYSAATKAVTVTASAQPNITSVGTLTELTVAANVTADFYFGDGGFLSNVTGGNAVPSGSNAQVQYNDNGSFGGDPGMTYNEGTSTFTANNFVATSTANLGAVGNVTITGGTAGQVLTTNGSNVLSWTTVSGGGSYSNANVANYLPTYTGNLSGSNLNVPPTVDFNLNTDDGNGNISAWTYTTDGKLYWPGPDDHSIYNGASNSFVIHGHNSIVISTDGSNANYQYQFYANGDLGIPGNVTATKFSGNGSGLSNIAGANVTGTVGNANLSQFVAVSDVNNNFSYHVVLSAGSGDKSLHIDADDNLQYNPADGILTVVRTDTEFLSVTNSVISNLIPYDSVGLSLGNSTNPWQDLYLSNSTIYLGDATISANGNSIVVDSITVTNGNVGAIGNIANINLNGNASTVLAGDGSWIEQGGGNGSYGNSNVAAYLPTYTGNLSGNSLTVEQDVSGNGALRLQGIAGGNSTINIGGEADIDVVANVGNINLYTANNQPWVFNQNGLVTFPDGTEMGDVEGSNTFGFYSNNANMQFLLEASSNNWVFDGATSNFTTPSNLVIGANGAGGSSIYQFDAPLQVLGEGANSALIVGWTANSSGPEDVVAIAFNNPLANGASNLVMGVGNNSTTVNYWTFANDGTTTFPTLTVDLHNGGNQTAQTLQFGDTTQQAIITGPTPTGNDNAQRLIIQGQRGAGTGEGGDVYFWAGDADNYGGDIKIYAGDADNASIGYGGYINIEGGRGYTEGGYVNITAGQSTSDVGAYARLAGGQGGTTGGTANVEGGYGSVTGGSAAIKGGYGGAGPGGNVTIVGGGSANGLSEYGNVTVEVGSNNWVFDNTGNLTLPNGGSIYGNPYTPSGAPGNTITLQPAGSGITTNQKLMIYPTAADGDHIHMTSGNLYETELFLGSDNFYAKLANTGDIVLHANTGLANATWTFGANSSLILPGAGVTMDAATNALLTSGIANTTIGTFVQGADGGVSWEYQGDGADANTSYGAVGLDTGGTANTANLRFKVQLVADQGDPSTNKEWLFDTTGNLTLPGNTFSVNYANGTQVSIGGGTPAGNNNEIQFNDNGAFTASGNLTFTDTVGGGTVEIGNELNLLGNGTIGTTSGNLLLQPAGNIVMQASASNLVFDITGNLILPGNTLSINYNNGTAAFGNISSVNLTGSASNVLYGNGTFAAPVAEASFSIQTANFNANAGSRYGVNTSGGAVTATLPASPATGAAIFFADAGGAYASNNLTIARNGQTIMGASSDLTVSTNNQSVGLFYNGTTWRTYNAG